MQASITEWRWATRRWQAPRPAPPERPVLTAKSRPTRPSRLPPRPPSVGPMALSLHTTDAALGPLETARPMLVDVVAANEIVPHLATGGACHAGPPISSAHMCTPM